MAANPLFTGTISRGKQGAIYNSGNNVLRQSNLNSGHGVPRGTSTPLRKKPRLGCPASNNKVDAMNESDPWNDDMIIDDDFLTACELAESQATQSHTAPKVAKLTDKEPKKVDRGCSNNNVAQRPHSTPPFAGGASTSAAPTGSKFTFKPTHRSVAVSQPFSKQTNVNNYGASQNSKVYYQPPSPTLSGGGTPPKSGSQNRSRNNSGSSRSRNNSGSGTPVKLKEPPKSLQQQLHKVQSNVVLPPSNSVQRTTNNAQFKSSNANTGGTPTWTSGTTIGQQQGQSNLVSRNQQQQHDYPQQQSVNRMQANLTPPAGSVATRESPDLPTATQEGRASQKPSLYQQQLEKLRLELETSQKQVSYVFVKLEKKVNLLKLLH